ncbi:DUF4062 domain-containing protein [Psychrosphaera algicola]|uniref:DUF4062 domain-containing protein n=1 Tax=Psychrosphaera algicola TaxID=3023714 RepID=A0ABT5FGB6_9GAMM|nr:DUF4062 domain-containing protein [Psychrosphaera sp. G1-22]MDC2890456.1 DUF4062 domain-containing protein [Psychrosphaera sp. G1-22]
MLYNPYEIRVFLSSTFEDMTEERNALRLEVFPELENLCQTHGLSFRVIDLNWGVTPEQVEQGLTIEHCLTEIENSTNSKIFFINIIGDRYGWVPRLDEVDIKKYTENSTSQLAAKIRTYLERRISITHMEIEHAIENAISHEQLLFYFRKPDDSYILKQLSPRRGESSFNSLIREKNVYKQRDQLEKLKAELAMDKYVSPHSYETPDELVTLISEHLTEEIHKFISTANNTSDINKYQIVEKLKRKRISHGIIHPHFYGYGSDNILKKINSEQYSIIGIEGNSGYGATTFLAHMANVLEIFFQIR